MERWKGARLAQKELKGQSKEKEKELKDKGKFFSLLLHFRKFYVAALISCLKQSIHARALSSTHFLNILLCPFFLL